MTDVSPFGARDDGPLHVLAARRALPGAERAGDGWRLAWRGTRIMAVVNVTPDSFSDGGRYDGPDAAVEAGRRAWRDGAWIVDVGGESTRPGAEPVGLDEEIRRVAPVVEALAATGEGLVSIDTRHPEVARVALEAGAHLVNDVGGLSDPAMRAACAAAGVPAVAMHMQGEPRTMQDAPAYDDVVAEVEGFLRATRDAALDDGVPGVVLDPGWGFGKRDADNLALVAALPRFVALGVPVLVGASRKGTIGRLAGEPEPARRDPGSHVVHVDAARAGAALVRVHDVPGAHQALAVADALDAARRAAVGGGRVTLHGLRFHGRHGVFPEEAETGARFDVDLEVGLAFPQRDALDATVDYAALQATVRRETEGERYALIEVLAERIARRVLDEHPRVDDVRVRVHKPDAPLPGVVGDVTAEVHRRR